MKWLEPLQLGGLGPKEPREVRCLATAGLDTTVNIFDSVLQSRAHELKGHSKGHAARDRRFTYLFEPFRHGVPLNKACCEPLTLDF